MIPTISLPQVLSPIQLEYLAKNNSLFWADSQVNEVKRSGLTSGPTVTLIDTGLKDPSGIAVDWISNLLFIGSTTGIIVCNLEGEYTAKVIENIHVTGMTVDPRNGLIYWVQLLHNVSFIKSSAMDGSNPIKIASNLSQHTKSLSLDFESNRLYFVSDFELYYCELNTKNITKVKLPSTVTISAVTVYKGLVYYADDGDQAIHSANKTTGDNDILLRNNTGGVQALRIYDPNEQTGSHPCANKKQGCQHLCLPTSHINYICKCAIGYQTHSKYPYRCIGVEEFLLYSIVWEINGIYLNGSNETQVLGPISKVSLASSIDFLYDEDFIFWADNDHGSITKIARDGTKRQVVIEQREGIENVPVDWLSGLAVDWVAKNLYWADPKQGVIEVARINGSSRYAILSNIIKPSSLVVDPKNGVLVWAGGSYIEKAALDGSNRVLLTSTGLSISDVTLDLENKYIYWCDKEKNTIESINYNGTDHKILLNHTLKNPSSIVFLDGILYWIDS